MAFRQHICCNSNAVPTNNDSRPPSTDVRGTPMWWSAPGPLHSKRLTKFSVPRSRRRAPGYISNSGTGQPRQPRRPLWRLRAWEGGRRPGAAVQSHCPRVRPGGFLKDIRAVLLSVDEYLRLCPLTPSNAAVIQRLTGSCGSAPMPLLTTKMHAAIRMPLCMLRQVRTCPYIGYPVHEAL